MKKLLRYRKPEIKEKKIKLNFFLANSHFFDAIDHLLVPNAFAQGVNSGGLPNTGCFITGTKIFMTDGTKKNIEKITKDDKVYSYCIKEKKLKENTVVELLTHYNHPHGYLIINGNLKITGNHRVWTNKSKWDRIENARPGDRLLADDGQTIVIKTIESIPGIYDVYNLHLEGADHNFFADNVLVHNCHIDWSGGKCATAPLKCGTDAPAQPGCITCC